MLEILSFSFMYILVFKTGILLCSSSWHETFYVDKAVLLRAGIIGMCWNHRCVLSHLAKSFKLLVQNEIYLNY